MVIPSASDKTTSNSRPNGITTASTIKRRITDASAASIIARSLRASAGSTAVCRDGLVAATWIGNNIGLESGHASGTAIVPDVAGADGVLAVSVRVHLENSAVGNDCEGADGRDGNLVEQHFCKVVSRY